MFISFAISSNVPSNKGLLTLSFPIQKLAQFSSGYWDTNTVLFLYLIVWNLCPIAYSQEIYVGVKFNNSFLSLFF